MFGRYFSRGDLRHALLLLVRRFQVISPHWHPTKSRYGDMWRILDHCLLLVGSALPPCAMAQGSRGKSSPVLAMAYLSWRRLLQPKERTCDTMKRSLSPTPPMQWQTKL